MNKKPNIKINSLNCDRCGKKHNIKIDFSKLSKKQINGKEPVFHNFICPNIALMYRVVSFALDTRVSVFRDKSMKNCQKGTKDFLKEMWGEHLFEEKLNRFIKLDLSFIGIPDEYYELLNSITSSYCCGFFYPAMTSAGALGERILNRLVIGTRSYFKQSKHYKKIWDKQSFENWDISIEILKDWKVISNDVSKLFLKLKKFRNDSIHYNSEYNFEKNSHDAIKILADIIDQQFNYMNRKDLFWVFDSPGEIFVKSKVISNPFVKEFILPHCVQITPFCEPTAKPPIRGENTPLKPLSDEKFIEIRKTRKNSS